MKNAGLLAALAACFTACSWAAEIVLPATALERDQTVTAVYRTNGQATGQGTLAIKWTDALGRIVEDRSIPISLTDESEVRFSLDLRRAVAMRNELSVRFTFEGVDKKGAKDHREEGAKIAFIAKPTERVWNDYHIVMWQSHDAAVFAKLKSLGIDAGQFSGRAAEPPEFLMANDLRWYAENIATDFYAEYHRYRRDRVPHWSFLQAKELYRKDPSSKEAFKRNPSLSDPIWLDRIHNRLVESARRLSPYRPLFYDLGDESGIADLAAFWDFDFSDHSLAAMREWLRERYGTLAALNQQWGKSFPAWESVTPETTNEAMKRGDDNFSAWADHKEWMDIAFSHAIGMGVNAIRSVDPDAYVAIAGAQMPGWGGYDYYRLSHVLTAVEPYDIGNNVEIIRSFNPSMPLVTTAFARGPWEQHRIWYELLHGARGNLIWDEKKDLITPQGEVGERGREVAPYYKEIRSGLGALLINSVRQADPIAIHYSQASMRTEWMLAARPKGDAWVNRSSATERMDSEFLRLRESYCRLIEDLGLQYRFVAYEQLEQGELLKRGYRVLILPRSSSLSDAEVRSIREFSARGGLVIAEGEPGAFDEHSRRLPKPALADLFDGTQSAVRFDALSYHQLRITGKESATHEAMHQLIAAKKVKPAFEVLDSSNRPVVGVETHQFRNGGVTIIGLLANPQLRVDELGPPDFQSNQRFEQVRTIRLLLPEELYAYDVRAGKALGRKREIAVTLNYHEPAILAFSPSSLPDLRVTAPASGTRGEVIRIGLGHDGVTPSERSVFHVSVRDPKGEAVVHYTANVIADAGKSEYVLRLAGNDMPGNWAVRVVDRLSGQERTVVVAVN
ncbi:MAG TPA: beta-galactosidase [Bryobacteraceae bacterium]|nr:beta-galactosidase [Bryobacteraceae bacterium]